jgi:hypothetical protein
MFVIDDSVALASCPRTVFKADRAEHGQDACATVLVKDRFIS